MILGVGIDSVPIARMEENLKNPATRFFTGTFTAAECDYCQNHPAGKAAEHFAGRLAVKEAFFKALGEGLAKKGRRERVKTDDFPLVEVVMAEGGYPTVELHDRLKEMATTLGVKKIWVSITHAEAYATALIILDKR